MMQCQFLATGFTRETQLGIQRRVHCVRCGAAAWAFGDPSTAKGNCRGRPLLGDRLAAILASLGIRKRRGCGCQKRQSALNRWHAALLGALAGRR